MSAQDTLARTLWAEARSEGRVGMEAVASVILARAAHPRWWGHDVESVCLAPWQFSCWQPEPVGQLQRMRAVTIADPYYKLALAVAAQALTGGLVDRTGGADSYANLHICSPAWAKGRTPCAVLGNHSFFRLELGPAVKPANPAPVSAPVEGDSDRLNAAEAARHAGGGG